MRAFLVPAALLITILAASLWSGSYVQHYAQRWIAELDNVTELLQEEQWDEIEDKLLTLHQDWKERGSAFHMILEHQDLDEADKMFSAAAAACHERSRVELYIHLQQLKTQLLFLSETQQTNLKNIF